MHTYIRKYLIYSYIHTAICAVPKTFDWPACQKWFHQLLCSGVNLDICWKLNYPSWDILHICRSILIRLPQSIQQKIKSYRESYMYCHTLQKRCTYTYIYIYIFTFAYTYLSTSLCIHVYMHMFLHLCIGTSMSHINMIIDDYIIGIFIHPGVDRTSTVFNILRAGISKR